MTPDCADDMGTAVVDMAFSKGRRDGLFMTLGAMALKSDAVDAVTVRGVGEPGVGD